MLFSCTAALSRLPLSVLYGFADWLIYPIMYYVIRYRRRLVRKNLSNSFPDKSEAERKAIERAFYHQFCDTIVETIYGYHCSSEKMREHVTFTNIDEVNRLTQQAGGCIFMLAHMGNWEWMAEVQQVLDPGILEVNVYRQLKSEKMDALMLDIRSKRGGVCVDKRRILREMVRFRAEKQKVTIGLLCDQKPRPEVTRTWVDFLHQDTGFLDGGEVLGTKFGYPVYYAYIRKMKRGCYEAELHLLAADPKQCTEGEITTAYAHALEQNILEQPELWLWTHNRWKWKRMNG